MAPYPDSLQTNTSSATAVNTAFHICCGTAVKWPQGAPLYEGQTPDANTMPHPILRFTFTYAESSRVTDGARTRALRSHNPSTSVAKGCCGLQNRLVYADLFAGGCVPLLRVAPWVVSGLVSNGPTR